MIPKLTIKHLKKLYLDQYPDDRSEAFDRWCELMESIHYASALDERLRIERVLRERQVDIIKAIREEADDA